MYNEFNEKCSTTDRKETYYPSIMINDHLYELNITDVPTISYFPVNSYYEWSDFRYYGLRSATAYILVFDLSNLDSFQFVRNMREQMINSRDMKRVPLVIVGNKSDLVDEVSTTGPSSSLAPPGSDAAQRKRRDFATLVKKHWKCTYVECSARENYGIVSVFKQLLDVIDSLESRPTDNKEVYAPMMDNIQEAFDGNKCVIT